MSRDGVVVEELRLRLDAVRTLGPLSFAFARGTLCTVTGPSGVGKTMLLSVLAGLSSGEGEVSFDGTPVRALDPVHLRRSALVLQGYGLIETMTAEENVAVVLLGDAGTRSTAYDVARAALDELGLSPVHDQLVSRLSGGQQQRVALARALVAQPDLLLADEPTSELDADSREVVLTRLVAHARSGACVVVATHDPVIDELADDRLVLSP